MKPTKTRLINLWYGFKQYWKTLSWALVIFWLSTLSVEKPRVSSWLIYIPHVDKLVHFFMYFVLVTLALSDYLKTKPLAVRQAWVLTALSCVVYGILMELVQSFLTSHRTGDILDAISNALGVLVGVLLLRYVGLYRKIVMKILI